MSSNKRIHASADLVTTGKDVYRIWKGKLRLGQITYRDRNVDNPMSASVAVAWDDGSRTTSKANFLRYIHPDADMSKIKELQMLFNEMALDISNEEQLFAYYLEQTGDEDLADQLADAAVHYGRQLTTQTWTNVTAATTAKSVQYGDFVISLDLGGDGYNIYHDGELWDEGYASIQKAMAAIDEDLNSDIMASQLTPQNVKVRITTRTGHLLEELILPDAIYNEATGYCRKAEEYISDKYGWGRVKYTIEYVNAATAVSDQGEVEEDELPQSEQEFTSERTSINSTKLPAVYKLISIPAGQVGIDYGGGKFDNAVEYMAEQDVTLVVYDPYNRTADHNKAAIKTIRSNGGADFAICSNVLNVIKEAHVRKEVLENIKKLLKPSGKLYLTVYEGRGDNAEGQTKSGYQLNRPTSGYLGEIQEVFPDATRKGKLIVATPNGQPVTSATDLGLSAKQTRLINKVRSAARKTMMSTSFGFPDDEVDDYLFVEGKMQDGAFVVEVRAELSYEWMLELADALNPVVAQADSEAYFDMEEPGIMTAYLRNKSILSAQSWDRIPELPLEPPEYPDHRYDMEEAIDFEFDLVIDVDDTGYYEYSQESQADFQGDGLKGEWYGEEYSGVLVASPNDLQEHLDELIYHMVPEKAGRYRISGTAHLVYEIEGVEPDTDDEAYWDSGDVTFSYAKSSVDDFKWSEDTAAEVTSASEVRRTTKIDLEHSYYYAEYSSGAKQIVKNRPYDDADYYYALLQNGKWLICKRGKVVKRIDESDIEDLNDIVEELEMVNSGIAPRMMHN